MCAGVLVLVLVLPACDLSPTDSDGKQSLATPTPLGTREPGLEEIAPDGDPNAPRPTRTPTRTSTATLTPTLTPGTPIPTGTATPTLTPFATPTPFQTPTPLPLVPTVTPLNVQPPTETPVLLPTAAVAPTETAPGQAPPPDVQPSPPSGEPPPPTPSESPTVSLPGILTPVFVP